MKKVLLTLGVAMIAMTASAAVDNLLDANNSTFENGQKNGWSSWGNGSETAVVSGGYDSQYCLELKNPAAGDDYYVAQASYSFSTPLENGTEYTLSFWAKSAEEGGSIQFCYQNSTTYSGGGYTTFNLTTEWKQYTKAITVSLDDMNAILFNFGKVAGTFYIDEIVFGTEVPSEGGFEAPAGYGVVLSGSTADGNKISAWDSVFTGSATHDGKPCIEYNNENAGDSYSHQLAIDMDYAPATTYYIALDVMGTPSDVAIGAWFQDKSNYSTIGGYSTFNTFKVTSDSEWTQVVLKGEYEDTTEANRVAINLGAYVGTLYITNIKVYGPVEDPGTDPEPEPGFTAPEGYKDVISGNTADGNNIVTWNSNIFENTTEDGVDCIKYTNATAVDSYSNQIAIDYAYEPETMYYITFDVMGTPSDVAIGAWYQHKADYTTMGYNDFNTFKVTSDSEWTPVVLQGQYTAKEVASDATRAADLLTADRVVINLGAYEGTLYLTNFKVYGPGNVNTIVDAFEVIEVNGPVYNLHGIKVGTANDLTNLPKGIYIVNGKKIAR